MNYARLATTAKRLLTKHGQDVTLRQSVTGTYDPDAGTAPVTTTDVPLKGALFDYGQGVTMVRGTLVEAADKQILLDASGGAPTPADELVVDDVIYTIVSVGAVNPAGVPIMYDVHARR